MRAIDDGGRRPSLPKNPTSSPPLSSVSMWTAAPVTHRSEDPLTTDHIMDDRSSTYTFGVPAMYHLSDSEQSYLDEEPLDQLSTSPITFAYTPPGAGDDDEKRRNSFVIPMGHDMQLRRGSIPMAIPETPRPDNRGFVSGDEIQATRKMSRSLDDDLSVLGFTEVLDEPGASSRSEPLSKADWSSFQHEIDSRTPTFHEFRRLSTQEAEEEGEDEPNAYSGLDLAYILGSGGSGGPRSSWSSESFVQHRPSVTQTTGGFAGFGISFGRDERRPSVATAGEDTFLRHLQHNDTNYALRLEEWSFGREKADAPGPRVSGLAAGGVVAPTIGPGTYEIWRCHMTGRFNLERSALQSSFPLPLPVTLC